jgi:hypothetical protein
MKHLLNGAKNVVSSPTSTMGSGGVFNISEKGLTKYPLVN